MSQPLPENKPNERLRKPTDQIAIASLAARRSAGHKCHVTRVVEGHMSKLCIQWNDSDIKGADNVWQNTDGAPSPLLSMLPPPLHQKLQ